MARRRYNPSVGATVAIALGSAAAAVALTGVVISMRSARAIEACMALGKIIGMQGLRPGGMS